MDSLPDDERAWLVKSEALWREAHRVAADHPGMDPGDVYHASFYLGMGKDPQRALLLALNALGVRYLIVGMGAALIEGAPGTTQDLDLWFGQIDADQLREAARRAGGLYTSGGGLQPPALGGEGLDRVDIVLTASGLDPFDREFLSAKDYDLDGVRVKVLPLDRVIVR